MATLLDVAILRTPVPRSTPMSLATAPPVMGSPLVTTETVTPVNATDDVTALDPASSPVANTLPRLDDIAIAIDRDDGTPFTNTILRARCDDVARRVIREGGHISMSALAREIGTTPPTLKRLMNTPIYRDTYNRISDELLGTIDDRIADERLDTLVRSDTLQRRALTVLSEAMMIARRHMADVGDNKVVARPQLLKVAVDAAAEVRQIVSARSGVDSRGAQVNINITRNQATIIQGAFRESGVDLSDVLDGAFVTSAAAAAAAAAVDKD